MLRGAYAIIRAITVCVPSNWYRPLEIIGQGVNPFRLQSFHRGMDLRKSSWLTHPRATGAIAMTISFTHINLYARA